MTAVPQLVSTLKTHARKSKLAWQGSFGTVVKQMALREQNCLAAASSMSHLADQARRKHHSALYFS